MKLFNMLTVAAAVLVFVSSVSAQKFDPTPRPVRGQAEFLKGSTDPLAPVNMDSYGTVNGGCSLDTFGVIDACFGLTAPDPSTGVVNEPLINSMADLIGVDLVAGVAEFTATDSLVCHGEDPNNPGMNLFTLTLTVETTDPAVELNPLGFANPCTGAAITEIAVFYGDAVGGASPVDFVDPITVVTDDLNGDGIEDTNIEIFDVAGGSATGGPLFLDPTIFFNGPDPWDGGVGIAFGGGIGDADGDGVNDLLAGQFVMNVTYLAVSKCPSDDCLIGDLNGDGLVTLLDVDGFVDAIINGTFSCEADANEDGVVDLLDVAAFIAILTG